MLVSYLNAHPHIASDGEIVGKLVGRNYKKVLAKAFGKQPFYVKAKGFKIFYCHPLDDKSSDIWNTLADMSDLHIIHLKRKNILGTLVSRKIAGYQDIWFTSSDKQKNTGQNKSVSFTVEELTEGFEQTRNWEQSGEALFKNHPLLPIYYEDLVDNRDTTFKKITDFLGFE